MDINCWRPSKPGLCPPDIVEMPMLQVLEKQFQNARTQEAAMILLETLKWNIVEESVATFKTRCTSLFMKAGIRDFQAKRSFVMGTLGDEMCRQIMRPVDETDMWLKIEKAVSTEESIKARKRPGRYSNESKLSNETKKKKDMQDLICYTCQKKGHISLNCPENASQDKDKDKRGKKKEYSRSDRSDEDTCYNYGGKGHRSPECPSKKRERKRFEK
jgi:Zinc knuckle